MLIQLLFSTCLLEFCDYLTSDGSSLECHLSPITGSTS